MAFLAVAVAVMAAVALFAFAVAVAVTAAMALFAFAMTVVAAVAFLAVAVAVMAAVALLALAVTVVVTVGVGVALQCALCQGFGRLVGAAGDAGIQLDPRLGQGVPCAHADAAADQRVHMARLQEARQSAVAAAVGIYYLLGDDLAVLRVVYLELGGVPEMLEYLSVFIRYCDSHALISFPEK